MTVDRALQLIKMAFIFFAGLCRLHSLINMEVAVQEIMWSLPIPLSIQIGFNHTFELIIEKQLRAFFKTMLSFNFVICEVLKLKLKFFSLVFMINANSYNLLKLLYNLKNNFY